MSSIMEKAKKFLTNKDMRLAYLIASGVFNGMDDRKYIEMYFKAKLKYKPDLDNPKTLCEKLNWLKLYNRRPEYTSITHSN